MKSWYINIPHIIFIYWDKKARVFEICCLAFRVKYYYIKEK